MFYTWEEGVPPPHPSSRSAQGLKNDSLLYFSYIHTTFKKNTKTVVISKYMRIYSQTTEHLKRQYHLHLSQLLQNIILPYHNKPKRGSFNHNMFNAAA